MKNSSKIRTLYEVRKNSYQYEASLGSNSYSFDGFSDWDCWSVRIICGFRWLLW